MRKRMKRWIKRLLKVGGLFFVVGFIFILPHFHPGCRFLAIRCYHLFEIPLFEDHLVQFPDELLGQRIVAFHHIQEPFQRFVVPHHLKMMAQGFTISRQAMQDQQLGLSVRQRVALNAVGVVVPPQAELLPDPGFLGFVQGTQLVEFRLQGVGLLDEFGYGHRLIYDLKANCNEFLDGCRSFPQLLQKLQRFEAVFICPAHYLLSFSPSFRILGLTVRDFSC